MNEFRVGQIVHYVARGSADGVFKPACRAAMVTELLPDALPPAENYAFEISSDDVVASVVVFNPTGLFFHDRCLHREGGLLGTWHTLDRCDT